jgi:spore maturation protein CgeB
MNILFFLQPGELTRFMLVDVLRGCEELGHRCFILELAPIERLYSRSPQVRQQVQADMSELVGSFIKENHIRLSVGMWANAVVAMSTVQRDGEIVSFFEAIEEPHLLMWLDSPERAHQGTLRPYLQTPLFRGRYLCHHTNNPASAREMTEVYGFTNVCPLPYGVNPQVFTPYGNVNKEFDIVFGGGTDGPPTAAMLEELAKDEPDLERIRHEQAETIIPALEALAGRVEADLQPAVRKVLSLARESQLAAREVPLLDRLAAIRQQDPALAPAVGRITSDAQLYVELSLTLRSIEHWQRPFVVSWLSRYFSMALFGDVDLTAWKCRARSFGRVPCNEQARVYSRGRLGLSVMRWQDDVGLHLKPFEITASGAACLCHHRVGVDDLWVDGEEIVTFRALPEARQKVEALLRDPARLGAIADAGRVRTLSCHTWAARMEELIRSVGQSTGRW